MHTTLINIIIDAAKAWPRFALLKKFSITYMAGVVVE
jgi:hypothetical protein